MKTVEEARELYCPFLSVAWGITAGAPNIPKTCQADECMFWRWDEKTVLDNYPEGYCGLVGKP